ncbi:MAG TPA: potassium channel family protein [Humisphaera sp.]
MSWKDDLNYGLAAFGLKLPDAAAIDRFAPGLAAAPLRNTAAIVAAASVAFLAAERGRNPKVRDIYDAMAYCSTCLSVGYHDIFPRTPVGKLIGTILMTVGPALAAKTLDGPSAEALHERVMAALAEIRASLPATSSAAPPAG